MIITGSNGKGYYIDLMSAFLNTIGFVALVTSIWDGTLALIVGMLIFIYDAMIHPYPVITELEDVDDDDDWGDDDMDTV